MTRLLVCAPLAIEARAVRYGLGAGSPDVAVVHTGMRARVSPLVGIYDAVALAGFGGAIDPALRPGDVLVATEVLTGGRRLPCAEPDLLAEELRRAGVRASTGPLLTVDRLVWKTARLSRTDDARAVDMEAGPFLLGAADRPVAVVRAIVDTPDRPLLSPATVTGGLAARRALRRIGPALVGWARAVPVTPSSEEGGSR